MADELLHQTVPRRHAAGDGDVGGDRAGELEKAEQAGPAAIDFRDSAHEIHRLRRDKDHVENRTRADSGDDADGLRRLGDGAADLQIERMQQLALGEIDQIAPVDDFARQPRDFGAGGCRAGAGGVEGGKVGQQQAGRVAVVAGAGFRQRLVQPRDFALA